MCNKFKRTSLHLALFIREENEEQICTILQMLHYNPHAILLRDNEGYTPLHIACQFQSKNYDIINLLSNVAIQVESSFVCNNADERHCCKCFFCGVCYYVKNYHGYSSSCANYNDNEIHNGKNSDFHCFREYDNITELRSPLYISCKKHTTPLQVVELLLDVSANHRNHLESSYRESLLSSTQPCNRECLHGKRLFAMPKFPSIFSHTIL